MLARPSSVVPHQHNRISAGDITAVPKTAELQDLSDLRREVAELLPPCEPRVEAEDAVQLLPVVEDRHARRASTIVAVLRARRRVGGAKVASHRAPLFGAGAANSLRTAFFFDGHGGGVVGYILLRSGARLNAFDQQLQLQLAQLRARHGA